VIVEIAGSSGSGKSTLLKEVLRECRERDVPAAAAEDFLVPWLSGVIRRNPTLLNLALDLRSVSEAITLRRHREFLAFAMAVIRRDTDRPATALSAYRGVLRKLSAHAALARKASHGRAVLVDEGTIHSAHYVLVHVNSAPRPRDIAAFCRLVPVPDLVIYVTAPLERVLERTFARRDPPLRGRSREEMERFIRHAHTMFDQLMSDETLSGRTLKVHTDDNDLRSYRCFARTIVDRIVGGSASAAAVASMPVRSGGGSARLVSPSSHGPLTRPHVRSAARR